MNSINRKEDIENIVNEAVKIKRDYPDLKYYEALEKAKEIFRDKKEPDADQS